MADELFDEAGVLAARDYGDSSGTVADLLRTSRQAVSAQQQQPAAAAASSPADQLLRQISEGQRRTEGLISQQEREKAPVIDAAIAENRRPGPAVPKLERESAPPKSNMQQQMQEWLMPMVALSAIAGAFSRQHATTALNAFSAGVQGLKEGNLQLYDQKLKEWKAANEQLLANNDAALKEYNAAWNNKKLNIDQKMNEIQLISAKYQDRLTYEASAQKNFTLVAQILQKQEKLTDDMKLQYEKLKTKAAETELKMAAIIKFKEENPNATAAEIQQFVSQSRPPRSASAMAVAKFLQENPEATSEDITNFNAQLAGAAAGARTEGTREAGLKIILRAADAAIPAALEASEKVNRTGFVPLNRIIQKGQIATSDPDLRSFGMANLQLAEHWAKAMNPTGVMRVDDRQLALDFLSTADSKETYKRLVQQLRTQIQRELAAVQAGKTHVGTSAQPGGPAPSEGGGAGASQGAAGAGAAAGGGMSDDELKKKLGIQ